MRGECLMKKIRKLTAMILALSMILGLSANTYAMENVNSKLISKNDKLEEMESNLPEDSIILQDNSGMYHIGIPNPSYALTPRGGEREAPNGGTYTDLSKSEYQYMNGVYIYSMTYYPPELVEAWLVSQVPDMREYVIGLARDYGINKAIEFVTSKLEIAFCAEAFTFLVEITKYTINGMNASMIKSISNNGDKGIVITYLTSVLYGNMPMYEPWNNYPYVPTWPNGGSGIWHDGYYNINLG